MSAIARGMKNTSRNWIRSGAVVLILAIGIGLALSMLVANQAVNQKIADLKANMGTTLTINPAGARGPEGGGEPLKITDANTIKSVAHVASVDSALILTLQNQDSESGGIFRMRGGAEPGKTNLKSAIEAGTLGRRGQSMNVSGDDGVPISLPITGAGISGSKNQSGQNLKITSGTALNGSNENVAIVGKGLAEKNNLSVGSTFTAYDTTFKVVGIFDQGNTFENAEFFIPLATAQRLAGLGDEISSIIATVDSIDNVDSTKTAITTKLGADKVDVTSTQENVQTAISSLESVKTVSVIGFVAALIAAGVITFLIMLVIVRERRREIGVLKAIGASNRTIVSQFMAEGMVLIVLGAVVGTGFALVSSNGIANALVSSNGDSSNAQQQTNERGPRVMVARPGQPSFGGNLRETSDLVGNVATSFGWTTLLYGLLGAFAIGLIGSALPSWFIARIRPAEVMRGE